MGSDDVVIGGRALDGHLAHKILGWFSDHGEVTGSLAEAADKCAGDLDLEPALVRHYVEALEDEGFVECIESMAEVPEEGPQSETSDEDRVIDWLEKNRGRRTAGSLSRVATRCTHDLGLTPTIVRGCLERLRTDGQLVQVAEDLPPEDPSDTDPRLSNPHTVMPHREVSGTCSPGARWPGPVGASCAATTLSRCRRPKPTGRRRACAGRAPS